MKKFKAWLNANPGMATTLRTNLGVGAAVVSNVKHSRTPMPTAWMPTVSTLSRGTLTTEYLVEGRNRVLKLKARA